LKNLINNKTLRDVARVAFGISCIVSGGYLIATGLVVTKR